MFKKSKYSAEEKLEILMKYEKDYILITELCRIYKISDSSFYKWKKQYEKYGIEGLKESKTDLYIRGNQEGFFYEKLLNSYL